MFLGSNRNLQVFRFETAVVMNLFCDDGCDLTRRDGCRLLQMKVLSCTPPLKWQPYISTYSVPGTKDQSRSLRWICFFLLWIVLIPPQQGNNHFPNNYRKVYTPGSGELVSRLRTRTPLADDMNLIFSIYIELLTACLKLQL